MRITLFSLLMSVLWSSVLAVWVHFCRKRPLLVQKMGTKRLLTLCLLAIVRLMVPCEFSFARAVPSMGIFQGLEKGASIHKAGEAQQPWLPVLVSVIGVVWVGVSAALLLRFLWRYAKSVQRCSGYRRCEEKQCQAIFWRILNQSGSQMRITVRRSREARVPMGIGIFRKSILLPEEEYSDSELYYILLHEYTHFRNHDLLVKIVVHMFSCIYWWNPAVYLLKKDLAQILEIQCDLDVTDSMQGRDKADYLATIVSVLKKAGVKRQARSFYGTTALVAESYESETVERFRIVSMDAACGERKRFALAWWAVPLVLFFCISYAFTVRSGNEAPKAMYEAEADMGILDVIGIELELGAETLDGIEGSGSGVERDSFSDIMKNAESSYMYLH